VAGKKIEKQVRKEARFLPKNVNIRRGHGVASGANHRGKPIMDSNIRHMSNFLSNVASSGTDTSKTNKRADAANDVDGRDNVASLSVGQTPIKDSNTRHLNSSSKTNNKDDVANDANRRDNVASLSVGQTLIKDSNTRHLKSSTMNVNSDPLLRNPCKNNRRDDGVPYLASQQDRQNPLKDKNIKDNNTFAMHTSLATLSRTDNNKRSIPVEANRQVNHASRPVKQESPRKNTNTKRVEAIMPNRNVTRRDSSILVLRSEDHDPLKAKTIMNRSEHINNSQSPPFKAMEGLVHKTKNFDGLDGYNDALPSRLKWQVSLDNGGRSIVGKHSDRKLMIKATKEASPKRMKKQRNTEEKGDDTSGRSPMVEINGDAYPIGVKDYSERNLSYDSMKRQRGNTKTNQDEAIDNSDMKLMEVEDGGTQLETCDRTPKNKKKRGIESNEVGDGDAEDSFAKKNLESLPKDHVPLDCSNEAIEVEKLTYRKSKKWRHDIMRNDDEELHVDGGDHSPLDADGDSSRLTSQAPISIHCLAEVPAPFVLEHVKQLCNYCSKPIDKPIWSGHFKTDGEEYISLAGHLSTKSCDKVWELSRSLVPVVEVTKLSSSKLKIWETSKPSCDNIGLYFFPNKMRHDEDLDKLVKEVIEGDLVLQTVMGEAEMLIFPSTLLPERYKTFQRKHYLWGVFRPRQVQCATVVEPVHDRVCCAQEKDKEEQHASNQQDEVQEVHWKSPAKSMQQAAATGGVPWSPSVDFQPEALEERQLGHTLRHTLHSAEPTAVATNSAAVTTEAAAVATDAATGPAEATENDANAATIPAEATEKDTNAATIPENHGRSDSIVGVTPGRFFCFVAEQTPKLEQLIQEMQREGSLVLAIRGEPIGGGLWPGNIVPTNISRA